MASWRDLGPYPELSPADELAVRLAYDAVRAGTPLTHAQLLSKLPLGYDARLGERGLLVDDRGRVRLTVLGALHVDDLENRLDLELLDRLVAWASAHYDPDSRGTVLGDLAVQLGVEPARLERILPLADDLGIHSFESLGQTAIQIDSFARGRRDLRAALHDVYASRYASITLSESADPGRVDLVLRGIEIDGFRALRRLTLPFASRLTVLVGANGAGKSTVLDAIAFVARASRDGVGATLGRRGLESIATAGSASPVSLSVRFDADLGGDARTSGEYGFSLAAAGRSTVVEREWLRTRHGTDERAWIESRRGIARLADARGELASTPIYKPAGELALTRVATDEAQHAVAIGVRTGLASFVLLDRDPALAQSYAARGGVEVEDIVAEIAKDESQVRALERALGAFLPRIERLERVVSTGERPTFLVVEKHVDRPLGVHELSAGARQLLLIAAVHILRPAPRIVLLEEPDAGLHVGALHALRDLVRELATHSVVVATSHSPTFVGLLDPEHEVVALEREGAEARARPLAEALRSRRWLEAFGAPGEAFARGGMERTR